MDCLFSVSQIFRQMTHWNAIKAPGINQEQTEILKLFSMLQIQRHRTGLNIGKMVNEVSANPLLAMV